MFGLRHMPKKEKVDLHIGGYHLTEPIGTGAMGSVFKATVKAKGEDVPVGPAAEPLLEKSSSINAHSPPVGVPPGSMIHGTAPIAFRMLKCGWGRIRLIGGN